MKKVIFLKILYIQSNWFLYEGYYLEASSCPLYVQEPFHYLLSVTIFLILPREDWGELLEGQGHSTTLYVVVTLVTMLPGNWESILRVAD